MLDNIKVEYDTMIPNNVGLSSDKKVLKALESSPCKLTMQLVGWARLNRRGVAVTDETALRDGWRQIVSIVEA